MMFGYIDYFIDIYNLSESWSKIISMFLSIYVDCEFIEAAVI